MKSQLRIRTEFSFRTAYGPIDKVVAKLKELECHAAAITDRNSTFGHIQFNKHCKAAGIKPIFGVELAFVDDLNTRERRQNRTWISLLARSQKGLTELYSAVEEATENFHYTPRLPLAKLNSFSNDIIVLNGIGLATFNKVQTNGGLIPVSDNYFIEPINRGVYEIMMGRAAFNRPSPMHIIDEYYLRSELDVTDQEFSLADRLAEECDAELLMAENIQYQTNQTLMELCLLGATKRGIELSVEYMKRLEYEIKIITDKGYTDYFFVIADLIQYAKTVMLVGPARGSSCGSLACYLTGITDIDPIQHNLIFERFIDVTRSDLPDVDIDFQDDRRHMVFEYLSNKYGHDKVARLGTISRYKAKIAIGETAKALGIPPWETLDLKHSIIERKGGDSRAAFCVIDTITETDVGRKFINKHPSMKIAADMEFHARHSGMHAAGVVITDKPIANYVARDARTNTVQIDKFDAQIINLLKIDALGLKTLTIIADCMEQIGWKHEDLLAHPLNDDKAFDLLRKQQYCGIFQFDGQILQSVARRIEINSFYDIAAITALARPGPFGSGATNEWILRRMGKKQVDYFHPMTEEITKETYGLVIYQEQVMRIARDIGQMTWEDITSLRRTMSKSFGIEYFDKFWQPFRIGALKNGLDEVKAKQIWDQLNKLGSWAFNKSHAIAYGTLSYWCAILKSHFPLEFALATLRNVNDQQQQLRYLRELDRGGLKFVPYDIEHSDVSWSIHNGTLLGGFTNIKGIGYKTAEDIVYRRQNNEYLTPGQINKLSAATTPFDNIFECRTKFPKLLAAPKEHGIVTPVTELIDIDEEGGDYVIIAKLSEKNLRSLNETMFVAKRNGLKVPNDLWLNLILEDDTASLPATISRFDYDRLGLKIVNDYKLGDWAVWKGSTKPGQRRLFVQRYKFLQPEGMMQ
jgi:DNA polymerase III alpha subunit